MTALSKTSTIFRKDVVGWSLYDFANTIYSMNIVSQYLKLYIVQDLGYGDRYFDIPFSFSMLLAALVLPALGAMSDYSAKKKIFLFLFTLSCCAAVGLLAIVPGSFIAGIIILFILSNFSYEAGQPFYNALLYSVAEGRTARYVSGVGVAFGYVGSILGMIFVLPFVTGDLFGLEVPFISGGGREGAFLPTAILFMLFALPLFFWVKESPIIKTGRTGIGQAYRDVWSSIKATKKYPGVLRFLIADYFFEDAVATVILNIGVYCTVVLGLSDSTRTTFLIISTVSAVIGSFVLGKIAEHYSLKKLIVYIVWGWIISLLLFVLTDSMVVIWMLGSVVGICLGGLWTTTRPMLAELVPRDELGRFFGLFALSGRAAAFLGPLVWTGIVYIVQTDNTLGGYLQKALEVDNTHLLILGYKAAIISLVVMLVIGLIIFRKVPHIYTRDVEL